MYSKQEDENLRQRVKLLIEAKDNIELQQILIKKCSDDPLFFFNMFLWTFKPKAVWSEWEPSNPNLPFITYDFQDKYILDIIECIETQQDNITEKSREMWFSWQVLWISLWWFLFKSRSWLIWSYKEDYVDTQWNMDSSFERLRYNLERLPSWIKPNDLISKYMSISSKELRAEIAWDSWKNFGTWWRRKYIFLDEFALWETSETAFRKTKDVTNCRIFWWTPEWKTNIYWKIMTNHPDYSHIQIKKFRLHWTLHPLKTQQWYEKQKQQRTKLEVAQELDISYDNSVAWAVYEDFEKMVQFKEVEYNPQFKLYSSWDFWRDSNAVIVWQKDFQHNKLYILKAIKRVNWDIKKFWAFITWVPIQWYEYDKEDLGEIEEMNKLKWLYAWHFWDPYNWDAVTTNATKSIKDILWELWIYLTLKTWSTVESRITATKLSLNRIIINYNKCINLVESMRQSKYPKTREWSQATTEKTKPVHDENSHYRTAFEYFIDNEPQQLVIKKTQVKINRKYFDPMKQQWITWWDKYEDD